MRQNDGGPAFPTPESHGDDYEGMTLRDYFAAKALQGLISNPNTSDSLEFDEEEIPAALARLSYEAADAMLAARVK